MSTRLPGAKYKRIFDRGRSVKGRLLVAWRLSSPDADRQAGVVVSKKSFHDAVTTRLTATARSGSCGSRSAFL